MQPTTTQATPMTQEEFLARKGDSLQCPFCRSEDVMGGKPQVERLNGFVDCSCKGCNKTWRTLYHAVGWFNGETRYESTGWEESK